MKRLILFLLLAYSSFLFAQKESYNWYFGYNAGISFHNSPPTSLSNSRINTMEGCASISDSAGQLLFYTDGITIYNRLHQIMPNGDGLTGNSTSTQSGVILKQPGKKDLYYVFAVDREGMSNLGGLQYSIVDMNLDSGYGDVVVTEKNKLVISPTAEKLAAVTHKNGKDIWVLTHGRYNNTFHLYLLSKNGLKLHSNQSLGSDHTQLRGYLKFSPTGALLACATNQIELFNFDISSGKISFIRSMTQPNAYGVEFSPNEKYLYSGDRFRGNIYQYDIAADVTRTVANNVILGALQNGPDARLYIAQRGTGFLGIIKRPNFQTPKCLFQANSIYLSGQSAEGLPNFITTQILADKILADNQCLGSEIKFEPSYINPAALHTWHFGDSLNNADSSQKDNPSYTYPNPGIYQVQLIIEVNGFIDTLTKEVEVYPVPKPPLDSLLSFCPFDSVELNAKNEGAKFKWNTGQSSQKIWVKKPSKYTVKIKNEFCERLDTIYVEIKDTVRVNLGYDTTYCFGDKDTLNAGAADSFYWSSEQHTQKIEIEKAGQYWVEKFQNACSEHDTILITYLSKPIVLKADTKFCELDSESIVLMAPEGSQYYWVQQADSHNQVEVKMADNYELNFLNEHGCEQEAYYLVESICPYSLIMPNGFTPNGDAINQLFRPQYFNVYKVHMRIFNRWGERVYEADIDHQNGWDGTFKGKDCPIGIYVYNVYYEYPEGSAMKQVWLNGNLTLLR